MWQEGRHKACPYGGVLGDGGGVAGCGARAGTRPAPTGVYWGDGGGGTRRGGVVARGQAQGLPLRGRFGGLGRRGGGIVARGQAQGLPLRDGFGGWGKRGGLWQEGRHKAGTYGGVLGGWGSRGGLWREGRHKACPYGGVWGMGRRGELWQEGRHKAGTYGGVLGVGGGVAVAARGRAQDRHVRGSDGTGGRGLAGHLRLGTCYEYRRPVEQACCRRGGVAGAEPPHKGGPNRPDRPEKQ